MKILFLGDVVGDNGVNLVRKGLPKLKDTYNPDITILNGENSHTSGTGITSSQVSTLFSYGVDVITGGNHSLRRCSIELYEENPFVICPQNFNNATSGCGISVIDMGRASICIANLIGTVFMDNHKNPFFAADEIVREYSHMPIIIDFHAEATSEKYALAHYLDGKVSAVVGTHTHVQTNDEQILPFGTGYITDLGCICSDDSVLGVKKELAIEKQKYLSPVKFEPQTGNGFLNGVILEIDLSTKKTTKIEKFHIKFD